MRKWKTKKHGGKKKRGGNKSHRRSISNNGHRKNVKIYGHVFSEMCIHCKNMANDWAALITRMKTTHEHVVLKDIGENHEAEMQSLNQELNIDLKSAGYPTIFRILEGKKGKQQYVLEYHSGERTVGSMMKWLTS